MSAIRSKSYQEYYLTEQEKIFIQSYCRNAKADKELIMQCAVESNDTLAEYLYKSVVLKKSYEQLGYVPIAKNDFYGYRRKLLAILKDKLIASGQLLIISGNIWSLYW